MFASTEVWLGGRELMGFLQTTLDKSGSDAMNAAGDYSSAYCILSTDSEFSGHGMVSRSAFLPWFFWFWWEGLCVSEAWLKHDGSVQLHSFTLTQPSPHPDIKFPPANTFPPANLTPPRPSQSAGETILYVLPYHGSPVRELSLWFPTSYRYVLPSRK